MTRPVCVWDCEVYGNFFSVAFKEVRGQQRVRWFERLVDQPLDIEAVCRVLRHWTVVGFNSTNYDNPVLALALTGARNKAIKMLSDDIIQQGLKWWESVELPSYVDGIDVMEVSPGSPQKPSLKLYAGRMHSRKMQDLPIDPSAMLTLAQMDELRTYGLNDLDVTKDLYLELLPQITLREKMSARYGVDLRSKSDAQVAEAVIKAEIFKRTGNKVYRPEHTAGKFFYKAPAYITFKRPDLQALLETFEASPFVVDTGGGLHPPAALEKGIQLTLGAMKYKAGYGGLHSMEKSVWWKSDDEYVLRNADVSSYYPSLILNSDTYPSHIGPMFLDIYRSIYRERMNAKLAGDKDKAEMLKICLNGVFGKFGSSFSALFSPDLLIYVTLTGQLAILLLIERIEALGMQIISANTDGVLTRVPRAREAEFGRCLVTWEIDCGFMLEATDYDAIYSRDVNSYVAFGAKTTRKGMFTEAGCGLSGAAGMKKSPTNEVCVDAVIAYLRDGIPVERTIRACRNIRKFLTVRRVVGGAEQDGEFIGKSVRYYWGVGQTSYIAYVNNGNKVPKSDGAVPCMTLPDELPLDIDYERYIKEAYSILQDVGVIVADPTFAGRTGEMYAHLPEQSTVHVVDLKSFRALCGRVSPSLRKSWVEVKSTDGLRVCKSCREGL